MDTSAIVLNKLLLESNLEVWAKLKLAFVDTAYASVYSAISRHYDKYNALPTFEELEITVRESAGQKTLATLKLIDEPDISAEVALDALIDQYTQDTTISLLEKFVDKLPIFDSDEIKENLSNIVMTLDEKTLKTEGVFTVLGGCAVQELVLVGGPRGSGKSITSSNILANQYESGNTSVLFTIEMNGHEVFERNMAILSDVSYMGIKNSTLSDSDMLRVIKTRAAQFLDADDLVLEYMRHRDKFKFEATLVREKVLKPDNQMIIVDDRALTLTSLDLHLGRIKSKFGDKFKVAVVDYLNQIQIEGVNMFDWQPQIIIAKKLKELARKHNVLMFSPYQVDSTGEARFAKGILDAADIALLMKIFDKAEGVMGFETTKIRGGPPMNFNSPINWETLRISPQSVAKPAEKEKIKKAGKKPAVDDSTADIHWDT